jgi:hypothetical protein
MPIDLPPKSSIEDPRVKLVRQIARIDCSAIPFSKIEVKTRDDGKPYLVVIARTYMIDPEGNVT